MKIFVQITSYRDPELESTIRDCIRRSKNPQNLYFGICWQREEKESLGDLTKNSNVRIADYSWVNSEGEGWAKSIAQGLYNGEDYTLQIDSHHRFEKNWDEALIEMIMKVDSSRPIISSFAGAYRSSTGEKLNTEPFKMSIAGFDDEKMPVLRPDPITGWENLTEPKKARFICGHYIFAQGSFCKDFKYDPGVYFEGFDASISARCFTMGYDLFHPNKNLIWHEYTREGKNKHWLDHTEELKERGLIKKSWNQRSLEGKRRVRQLLGILDTQTNLGEFGLGTARSLRNYEIYSGIDFSQQLLHPDAVKSHDPASIPNEEEWKKGITGETRPEDLKQHTLEISWEEDEIEKADDYDFWFFGFHDESGKQVYRKDLNWELNKDQLSFERTSIEVSFRSAKEPKSCVIWPHSKSRGWLKRIESVL